MPDNIIYWNFFVLHTENLKVFEQWREELRQCRICPRNCNVDRFAGDGGYCRSGAGYYISSIVVHRGEEPPISGPNGICNVFFGHCNLQCVYCQNFQISRNDNSFAARNYTLQEVLTEIITCLDGGCEAVGFVSPSHFVPQVKAIVGALKAMGRHPVIVYNTNGYDKPETLKTLEGIADVYLPDFKYMDGVPAKKFSGARDYPRVAQKAIREMYRQKGSSLILRENGIAERGLIIRHLVLPGHVQNSIDVLRFIADEISTSVHISLMSQYHPVEPVRNTAPLNRPLFAEEYQKVVEAFHELGFRNGWIQDMDSYGNYLPDFDREQPFGE